MKGQLRAWRWSAAQASLRALYIGRLAACVFGLNALAAFTGKAGPHVYSLELTQREWEFETRLDRTNDQDREKNGAASVAFDIGYTPLSFWKIEIENQWARDPGQKLKYDSIAVENLFQFTETGEYWLDTGFFFEYERVSQRGDHDNVTFGPVLQKEWGPVVAKLNLLVNREIGSGADEAFNVDYRAQTYWQFSPSFRTGIELYGEPGPIDHFKKFEDQRLRAGPVVLGTFPIPKIGKFKYELAYMFGLNTASEHGTLRGLFEFERAF
jgi:hypothetical protein